jgi:hypothetical protein
MKIFRSIACIAAGIYISIGVLLFLFHPRLDTTEQLVATSKGKSCDVESWWLLTRGWPFYLKYYYGGGFDACREDLFRH